MALPAPNLDDRRFQDLVDDAKRMVQQRCPEWTDHNVHDPGVTLIEVFAWMTDQLLYRLNQVPDRTYVKFLDLLGVELFPPAAAQAPVTFWLSAPQDEMVTVPRGTQVSTRRSETQDLVVFTTVEPRAIVPCSLARVRSTLAGGETRDHARELDDGDDFACFAPVPEPGDALLVGLSEAVPSCAVALRMTCHIEGVGVDPTDPPLRWEAWTDDGWRACEVDRDDTGGMNRPGDLVVHVPEGHEVSVVDDQRAGWLRAVVLEAEEHQPAYSSSPQISAITAMTVGGTVQAANLEVVTEEILGFSEYTSGQHFDVARTPVLGGGHPVDLEVSGPDGGWTRWTEVEDFADSGPDDAHFTLDHTTGEVRFGPAVQDEDGTVRRYGAIPAKGCAIRMARYSTGGGEAGNVHAGAIRGLRQPIALIDRVENRHPAVGGRDGETLDNAKTRGPLQLRARNRAVTLEDYGYLASQAAPDAARVRGVAAGDGADEGGVRVLVVPHAPERDGVLAFEQLIPSEDMLGRIAERLDECRTLGARVVVEPPSYQGITVVARVVGRPNANPNALQRRCREALGDYFHPIRGGPDGDGWPFGRPVHVGEVYAVLQALPGVEMIADARLFPADPVTGERGSAEQRIELDPHALVFSYDHQVRVE